MAGAKRCVVRSQASEHAKITKAMEMVAASKCVIGNRRIAPAMSYAETMRKVIESPCTVIWNISTLTEDRDVKRVGYGESTDRGLCGGLNINLFKTAGGNEDWTDKGVQCDLAMIGSKGVSFFNSVGGKCCCPVTGMGITLPVRTDRSGKVMLQAYDEGRLDNFTLSATNLLTPCLRFRPSASCCRYRHQMMMI